MNLFILLLFRCSNDLTDDRGFSSETEERSYRSSNTTKRPTGSARDMDKTSHLERELPVALADYPNRHPHMMHSMHF